MNKQWIEKSGNFIDAQAVKWPCYLIVGVTAEKVNVSLFSEDMISGENNTQYVEKSRYTLNTFTDDWSSSTPSTANITRMQPVMDSLSYTASESELDGS